MTPAAARPRILHASAVGFAGRGVLITGDSGSGKSALALNLMALGAGLIADDQTEIFVQNGTLIARAPATLPAMIEARGIGLLPTVLVSPMPILLVVDMTLAPASRMPPSRYITLCGVECPVWAGQVGPHLAASLFQTLKTGYVPHHD
ncbi:HPr kinase/phosphorylase [Oceaniglobus ichthyenteri]|uniref:HPr kinase/phosphorylase n=1 Tax=Oceaniglobus ichthyenteri TaxID=2136177 RepID=UPI0013DE10B6|nr:HPr kinase/phosphatase C-terminal domain-containing protein [Oceaniglobus ichthyenteri]